jgi:hypothetical protein
MRDWRKVVQERLAGLALEPEEKREVLEELAEHLEESHQVLLREGISEEDAAHRALSEVPDWNDLRHKIYSARTKENSMTNRVKQFWLPTLITLLLSMGLLMLVQFFGPNPWVIGRKSAWSLIAPVAVVYLPWLFSLPLVGAIGAYVSSRAGGSRRVALSSIVFPVLPYFVFFLVALPVTAIFNDQLRHNVMFLALFVGLLAWVLAPGAALLAGGLLARFMRDRLPPGANSAGKFEVSSGQTSVQ